MRCCSLQSWRQVYAEGALTNFYNDTINDVVIVNDPLKVPIDPNTTSAFAGPGKRWRHSMVIGTAYYNETNGWVQPTAIYGGHRLWQGYSPENSQDNNWDIYETRPLGGYLDDLWVYTKFLDTTTVPGSTFKTNYGEGQHLFSIFMLVSFLNLLVGFRNSPFMRHREVGEDGAHSAVLHESWTFVGLTVSRLL